MRTIVASMGLSPRRQNSGRAIEATFHAAEGNKTRAAKLLGIGLKTFYRKLVKYKIPH